MYIYIYISSQKIRFSLSMLPAQKYLTFLTIRRSSKRNRGNDSITNLGGLIYAIWTRNL